MPGGIHPPLEVILSWPTPNYINPVERPKVATFIACTLGPISLFLIFVRLWVRLRLQRSGGLDDWLMIAAIIPLIVLTVLIPVSADKYHLNKHVWDVNPSFFVIQRKFILATEVIFCVTAGLIKVSILLFYRRLSDRSVSTTFRRVTWLTIAYITGYSVAFTIVPIFGCRPISAFWDQLDIGKVLGGYKYTCFNEGADVFAAGLISTTQDFITALLPTFIYWNLQIPIRQKVALFAIFALAYGVVAFGILRTVATWDIFFETYDVTWAVWKSWNWTLLEIHIGAICANAPALKVFFKQILQIKSQTGSGKRSNSIVSIASTIASVSKYAFWRRSYFEDGYLSEPHQNVSADHQGGLIIHRDFEIRISRDTGSQYRKDRQYDPLDVEMGDVFSPRTVAPSSSTTEDLQALPKIPAAIAGAYIQYPEPLARKETFGLSLIPKTSLSVKERRASW